MNGLLVNPSIAGFLRGIFLSHASVTFVAGSRLFLEEEVRRSGAPGGDGGNAPPSEDFLTLLHEREHYWQSISTPCGLLQWRIAQCLLSDASWMLRMIQWADCGETVYFPLTHWYWREGRQRLQPGAIVAPPHHLARLGRSDPAEYGKFASEMTEFVAKSIEVVVAFFKMLADGRGASVGDFVTLANLANPLLANRSGIKSRIQWTTQLPAETPLIAFPRFSVSEIQEAGARLQELLCLVSRNDGEEFLAAWYAKAIHGVYQPAFQWLLEQLGSPVMALLAIDIACTTPMDVACECADGGEIRGEDVHPSWRLVKVVEVMRNRFKPLSQDELGKDVAERIAEAAGIPTPRSALLSLQGRQLTQDANWGGKLVSVEDGTVSEEGGLFGSYFDKAEQRLHSAFSWKLRNPLACIEHTASRDFMPMMEFFENDAWKNRADDATMNSDFFSNLYFLVMDNLLRCHAIFGEDFDISLAEQVQEAMTGRLRREMSPEDLPEDVVSAISIERMANLVFGEVLSGALDIGGNGG